MVAIWVLLACVDVVLVGAFTALGVKSEEQNQARKGMIAEQLPPIFWGYLHTIIRACCA